MLWTTRIPQCTIFQTFECSVIKVHPISHPIFENTILHHCSVPWKITPLYLFSSNLRYFRQKKARLSEIFVFLSGWVKIHQIPHGHLLKRRTTWNDLQPPTTNKKQPETTYSDIQRARNDLKRPTTTYNEQETTWNNLQRPTTSKKRPETTYNKQETTWNDPQRVRHNLQWPETTYNE